MGDSLGPVMFLLLLDTSNGSVSSGFTVPVSAHSRFTAPCTLGSNLLPRPHLHVSTTRATRFPGIIKYTRHPVLHPLFLKFFPCGVVPS